jgi:hypothetical protein
VRTCLLACERLDGHDLIKLGALGDSPPLYPHIDEPLIAARQLVGLGFKGMVYSSDDPAGHMPRRLSGAGLLATERSVSPSGDPAFVARCGLPCAPTGRFCDGMRAVAFSMNSVVSCRSLSSRNRAVAAIGERQKPARSAPSIL